MSALPPIPTMILPQGDVTPAMRVWMGNMLADSVAYDNSLASAARLNALIDGGMQVAQGATQNLSGAATYGSVDMWAVWMSSGVRTAGTIGQAGAVTSTSLAVRAAAFTGTGTVTVSFRQRVESKRAQAFGGLVTNNASASLVAFTQQACSVQLIVRKPTAADNYAATTVVYTGNAQALAASAWTTLKWEDFDLGDVRNGIEVEIQFQYGTAVASAIDARLGDVQLVFGAYAPAFIPRTFDEELQLAQRYFQKSFEYATAPAQGGGVSGATYYRCPVAGATTVPVQVPFLTRMRTAVPTFTFYNPVSANAKWRNTTLGADSGAASVTGNGDRSQIIANAQVAGDAVGNSLIIHWTADARL